MATVHLARDSELERPVALKLLAENLADDKAFRKRFVREGRLAARLSHPNVVQVYDVGESDGRPYIVMEYVPGETLASVLTRRRKLPPVEAAGLAHQAALGLQAAHEAGLVHRDVKPQNVIVRDDGVVKIADFGIARAAEATRLTELGTILGTAAYLAPEQAAGEDVSAAADVYSLGAVLYELLTGRPPYEFSSIAELATQQASGAITPVRNLEPAVPEELEALVMSCLAREPQFRPSSAAAVAEALAGEPATERLEARRGETKRLSGSEPQARQRTTRRVFRNPALLWFAGAVVAATIALALGLAHLGGGGSGSKSPSPPPQVARPAAGATPADEARNLSRWLRAHSR